MRKAPSGAVLLWGLPNEEALSRVGHRLRELQAHVLVLDQRRFRETSVEIAPGDPPQGTLHVGPWELDLASVRSAYLRPYDIRRLQVLRGIAENSALASHALRTDELITAWTETTPALIVNRPSAMASNNSKPYQAAQAASTGFAVPPTLITTDPGAVRAFQDRHGEVVYKSISGTRSIVHQLDENPSQRLADVATCPTQFQRRIRGTNYRVHVIGTKLFTCRITSDEVDYRYDRTRLLEPCDLPDDVAGQCLELARTARLVISGIDLMHGTDGLWYCFEANPSPGFSFFEDYTHQPIAEAIAALLLGQNAPKWAASPASRQEDQDLDCGRTPPQPEARKRGG